MRKISYINVTDDVNSKNVNELMNIKAKSTLFITEKFGLPSLNESSALFGKFELIDVKDSKAIAEKTRMILYGVSDEAREIIISNMFKELETLGATETAQKNAYIKVIFWLKTMFMGILDKPTTIVIYKAPLGKYEVYTLYVLSKLGINVVVISKEVELFKNSLYPNVIFELQGTDENLALDGDVIKGKQLETLQELKAELPEVETSTKVVGCNDNKIVELNNFLVYLETALDKKTSIIFKHEIPKPNYTESNSIQRPQVDNKAGIIYTVASNLGHSERAKELMKFYKEFCMQAFKNEANTGKIFNKCSTLVIWLKKYILGNPELKIVLHYGIVDNSSDLFLGLLDTMGIKVIAVCSQKENIKLEGFRTLDLGESHPLFEFPTGEIREKQATIAYNASKEIDALMYSGQNLGLYRDRQFNTCRSIVMSTTYDEIGILWHQESKFRPHFEVVDNVVTIPNFFVKISGCSEDYQRYLNEMARLVDDNTIVHYSTMFANIQPNNLKMHIRRGLEINGTIACEQKRVIDNHKINPDVIMSCKNYGYGFLSRDTQLHMMYKIQELVDSKCIDRGTLSEEGYYDTILNVVLNLNTEVLRLIQWFDFTKLIPKVVVISQTETQVSYEDTIYLAYLGLIGFDIALIVPNAYNSVERYLSSNMYQEHIIGQPKFDTRITNLKVQPEHKGWFNRIFNNN